MGTGAADSAAVASRALHSSQVEAVRINSAVPQLTLNVSMPQNALAKQRGTGSIPANNRARAVGTDDRVSDLIENSFIQS